MRPLVAVIFLAGVVGGVCGAALKDVPPMPAGTVLFSSEQKFGERGRFGGYAMKPSKYGVFPDLKVKRPGSSAEPIFIRYRKKQNPYTGWYNQNS